MSLEQTYNNKPVIGTNIQHQAYHWNKHTTISMSLEQTYNISMSLEQAYNTKSLEQTYNNKHVIGTNIQQ